MFFIYITLEISRNPREIYKGLIIYLGELVRANRLCQRNRSYARSSRVEEVLLNVLDLDHAHAITLHC